MMYLLDINLLIALSWPNHVHHHQSHRWFEKKSRYGWTTCPTTQLGFIRISSNSSIVSEAVSVFEAKRALNTMVNLPDHHFLADSIEVHNAIFMNLTITGHRQIIDAYLLALSIQNDCRLATLDKKIQTHVSDNSEHQKHIEIIF